MNPTMQMFETTRVNRIMQALVDIRTLPQTLVFSGRVKDVPVLDSELTARYVGYAQIADLVADDAEAVTYNMGKFSLETTNNFNMKIGVSVNQEMLNYLNMLSGMGTFEGDMGNIWQQYESRTLDAIRLGLLQRKEFEIAAMLCDGDLGQAGGAPYYSRLGFTLKGSWGMPSDLKVTTGVTWDTPSTATPVNDILAVKLLAQRRYGAIYNRVTMSTACFQYMINTTEFQNKARMFLAPNVSFVNLALANLDMQRTLANNVLGMMVELYDGTYTTRAPDGTISNVPFLPITKVILDSTGNDNNLSVQDFGNAVVTESLVSNIVPTGMVGALPNQARGPVSYVSAANASMNPPGLTYWGVQRAWPRKHWLQANACLTVGTFADTVPLTNAF